jgi:hypothetical protein
MVEGVVRCEDNPCFELDLWQTLSLVESSSRLHVSRHGYTASLQVGGCSDRAMRLFVISLPTLRPLI